MPKAARVHDPTEHVAPLGSGPGSPNVNIGRLKAWRALPAGALADLVEAASDAVGKLLAEPTLNPAAAAAMVNDLIMGLVNVGTQAVAEAAAGAPVIEQCFFAPPIVPVCPPAGGLGVSAAANSATTTLLTTNATLTTAWATAAAAPGGQPGADLAYTMGIQSAAAAAASSTFSALGGMADLHNCPMPAGAAGLHGPGVVTRGSKSVRVNGPPAARQEDKVVEACGGADPIILGCGSVNIGD
jgi:uncharacterized Zn-binding protein involved in type VI secretion